MRPSCLFKGGSHNCSVAGACIEAPHIITELHDAPEVLLDADGGIREVHDALARHDHIVGAVELQPLEIVQQLPRSSGQHIQHEESATRIVATLEGQAVIPFAFFGL